MEERAGNVRSGKGKGKQRRQPLGPKTKGKKGKVGISNAERQKANSH